MTAPPEPVTVDVRNVQARQIAVGAAVAGALGLIAVVSAITDDVDGGTGTRVAVFAIGLVFTLIGALPLLMWRIAFRPRRLVIDAAGLRWDDPSGAPWAVRWTELAAVTLSYPDLDIGVPRTVSAVNLDLRPAEPGFRDAHPEMEHLAAAPGNGPATGYRLPFGHAQAVVGPIDRALRAFAPAIYHREGPEIPRPLDRPWSVKLGVGIIGSFWGSLMVFALAVDGPTLMTLTMVVFWTSLFAWWLARVWAGGPIAAGRMAGLAKVLGVVYLAGAALFALVAAGTLHVGDPAMLLAFLPGLASGAVLIICGRLLSREEVRLWCASRGWGL